MTNENQTDANANTEALQAVVDRVGGYQDGAPEGTVEQELRRGLDEAGIEVSSDDITKLAREIEEGGGKVRVEDVLS